MPITAQSMAVFSSANEAVNIATSSLNVALGRHSLHLMPVPGCTSKSTLILLTGAGMILITNSSVSSTRYSTLAYFLTTRRSMT